MREKGFFGSNRQPDTRGWLCSQSWAEDFGNDRGSRVDIMRIDSLYVVSSDVYFKVHYKQGTL